MKEINLMDLFSVYNALNRNACGINKYGMHVSSDEQRREREDLNQKLSTIAKKIDDVIKSVEGKAKDRLLDHYCIYRFLKNVEDELQIKKQDLEGTKVFCDPNAQDFPNSYHWNPLSTSFIAEYRKGSWRLIDVSRRTCRRARDRYDVELSESARDALLERFRTLR